MITLTLMEKENKLSRVTLSEESQTIANKEDYLNDCYENPWFKLNTYNWIIKWLESRHYNRENEEYKRFYPKDIVRDVFRMTEYTKSRMKKDMYWVRID